MVLGVVGVVGVAGCIVVLPVVVCPLAWYFGALAERETARYRRTGAARTGMILGIMGVALLMLLVIGTLVVIGSRYDAGYGT